MSKRMMLLLPDTSAASYVFCTEAFDLCMQETIRQAGQLKSQLRMRQAHYKQAR